MPRRRSVGDYLALLKPRVMSLVVFTALVGMAIAPGGINPVIGFAALARDRRRRRRLRRAQHVVRRRHRRADAPHARRGRSRRAASRRARRSAFGLIARRSARSRSSALPPTGSPAALLAFTIFFYVVVYTMWLKRSTPQNIVIGGAAGALPPVIGWAAATGTVGVESLVLFLIIFLWTPPHFWALSLYKRRRLRQGRRADAAGRRRRGRDQARRS